MEVTPAAAAVDAGGVADGAAAPGVVAACAGRPVALLAAAWSRVGTDANPPHVPHSRGQLSTTAGLPAWQDTWGS